MWTLAQGTVLSISNSTPSTSNEKKSTMGFPTANKIVYNGKHVTLTCSAFVFAPSVFAHPAYPGQNIDYNKDCYG